jgi:predicted HTH transcriptional regulator
MDRTPVPDARLEDLDMGLVRRTIESGVQLNRFKGADDPAAYLLRFGGVVDEGGTLRPTVAGVLAFCPEPERWVTASGIDIALYRTNQALPTRAAVEQVRGPVFQLIDEAVALLQKECTVGHFDGARLVTELDTPLIVLRELTTNAVVHRDLSLYGSVVRVQVFVRHIEWSSPGGLPEGVTVDNLLTAQFARNPALAQFLFHAGYIEKFGMGLDAVIEALQATYVGRPDFHDDGHSFRVRVPRRTEVSLGYDLSTRQGRTGAILNLFSSRLAWRQQEIMHALGLTRSTVQRDLKQLVDDGILEVQGATKTRVYSLRKR